MALFYASAGPLAEIIKPYSDHDSLTASSYPADGGDLRSARTGSEEDEGRDWLVYARALKTFACSFTASWTALMGQHPVPLAHSRPFPRPGE